MFSRHDLFTHFISMLVFIGIINMSSQQGPYLGRVAIGLCSTSQRRVLPLQTLDRKRRRALRPGAAGLLSGHSGSQGGQIGEQQAVSKISSASVLLSLVLEAVTKERIQPSDVGTNNVVVHTSRKHAWYVLPPDIAW
jgi:hypothetical protein